MNPSGDRRYEPGSIVFLQGEPMSYLFILRAGSVEVIHNPASDLPLDEEKVNRLGQRLAIISNPGEVVGEMGAILETRSASLRTGPEGAVLQSIPLDKGSLSRAIEGKPSLGVTLARTLARRLADNNRKHQAMLALWKALDEKVTHHAQRYFDLVERTAGAHLDRPEVLRALEPLRHTRSYAKGRAITRKRRREAPTDRFARHLVPRPEAVSGHGVPSPLTAAASPLVRDSPAGALLFRQGDRGAEFYVVLDGALEVELEEHRIYRIDRGGIVGEMAVLLDEEVRTATVRAAERARLLVVSRDRFQEIATDQPWILVRLAGSLAERLARSNDALSQARRESEEAYELLAGSTQSLVADFAQFADLAGRFTSAVFEVVRQEIEESRRVLAEDRDGLGASLARL